LEKTGVEPVPKPLKRHDSAHRHNTSAHHGAHMTNPTSPLLLSMVPATAAPAERRSVAVQPSPARRGFEDSDHHDAHGQQFRRKTSRLSEMSGCRPVLVPTLSISIPDFRASAFISKSMRYRPAALSLTTWPM
jgi:hypothetical protein